MDAAGIAQLLTAGIAPPVGSADMGFHTGVIKSWDESSGVNVVTVQGVDFSNLGCVQGGIGVLYQSGDVVAVMRFQTRYFVFGKIAAPGAGAANQIRSASVTTTVANVPPQGYGDLPGSAGPTLTNVYIGSSRRCLVMVSAQMNANNAAGFVSVSVTGDSTVSPGGIRTGQVGGVGGTTTVQGSGVGIFTLTSADGLNSGFHTFTSKYAVSVGTGSGVDFYNRCLTVIPF